MLPKEALQQLQTHGVLQYALQYDIYGGGEGCHAHQGQLWDILQDQP